MKKLMSVVMIVMMIAAVMVPMCASANAIAPNTDMWVNCKNGKNLNVRTAPNTKDSKILYRLTPGTKVEIDNTVAAPKGWAFVNTAGHKDGGFVMTKFLQVSKPGKYEITERDDHFVAVTPYIVSAKALNSKTDVSVGLRVKPNKTSQAIRRLDAGDQLQVIARGKVWSKVVDLQTGKTGYVANDYLMAV